MVVIDPEELEAGDDIEAHQEAKRDLRLEKNLQDRRYRPRREREDRLDRAVEAPIGLADVLPRDPSKEREEARQTEPELSENSPLIMEEPKELEAETVGEPKEERET